MAGTKRKTAYGMEDRIKFGQYRDKLIRTIVETDPRYIDYLWAVHECEFEQDVWKAAKEQLRKMEVGQ